MKLKKVALAVLIFILGIPYGYAQSTRVESLKDANSSTVADSASVSLPTTTYYLYATPNRFSSDMVGILKIYDGEPVLTLKPYLHSTSLNDLNVEQAHALWGKCNSSKSGKYRTFFLWAFGE